MTRLIYVKNDFGFTIIDRIPNTDGTVTSTPHDIFEGSDAEVDAFIAQQTSETSELDAARSAMSVLVGTLPVESRAKFAEIRAAIEKLLDLGDIEAAHYKIVTTPTDTSAELSVKNTLVAALANFLPSH
jgi:hypothetical protein